MSKSVRQRWIRKVKKYVACLRAAHHIKEHSSNAFMADVKDTHCVDAPEAATGVDGLHAAAGAARPKLR
jgi:hypothetical protein